MHRIVIPLALSSALLVAVSAYAQSTPPVQDEPQKPVASTETPIKGRALGEHVSGHAPEHPREMGRKFGECVSELAITGICPHDVEEHDG